MNKAMRLNCIFQISVLSLFLAGCVGLGAPISTPYNNVMNAQALLKNGRPLPAETLIKLTIEKSQKNGDESGLAMGYWGFAYFIRYYDIKYAEEYFAKKNSIDPTVTFENRFEKARDYLKRAIDLYAKHDEYDRISNAYLNLATLEASEFNNKARACPYLALSLQYNEKFKEHNPNKKVDLIPGYTDFRQFIDQAKKECACR